MRKLLPIFVLVVCAAPAHAAISLAQAVKHANNASGTNGPITITALGSGHDLCVAATGSPSSADVTSITTSGADTLTFVTGTRATDSTSNNFTTIWCKAGATAGITTVTIGCTSCTNQGDYIYEIAGALTASITGTVGVVTNGAACTSCVGPAATTGTTNSLVILIAVPQNTFSAAGGTGFTDDLGGTLGERASHNITTSTINMNTGTFTQTSGTYAASGVEIKAAAGAAATPRRNLFGVGT